MQEEFYCSSSVLLLQKLASQYHTSATRNRPPESCNLISFLWKFNNIQRYISVSPCYDFAKANVDVKRQVSCFIFGLHQYFAQDMLSSEIGQITCRCKMLQYHVSYNWTKPDDIWFDWHFITVENYDDMPKSQDISSKFSLSEEPFASLYDVAVRPSEASQLFSDWHLMRPDEMCLQKMSQQEILLQSSSLSNINISATWSSDIDWSHLITGVSD